LPQYKVLHRNVLAAWSKVVDLSPELTPINRFVCDPVYLPKSLHLNPVSNPGQTPAC
jgi:hypothetical protein